MIEAVLEYGLKLKKKIKNEAKQHSKNSRWASVYENYKQLYSMMIQLLSQENIAVVAHNTQPIPKVFQNIHQTSIDMRRSLLDEIKNLERQKIEIQAILIKYKEKIDQKQERIDQLQAQIAKIKKEALKPQFSYEDKLKNQVIKLEKYNKLLKQENQKLKSSQKLHIQSQERLRHQLKDTKNAFSRIRTQVQSSSYFQDIRFDSSNQNNQGKNTDDNILPSFSDYPERNFTVIDNRQRNQQPYRKVKSTYAGDRNIGLADQLWRFIYIQACQIEQFVQSKQEQISNDSQNY